ncbi:hypothetical protein BJ165DRAFT_1607269 [Panaeolus papilionaceus]|nr:hypothetical protein BJ165DRAFT_1607269 [Panaeolus papilionaceus]
MSNSNCTALIEGTGNQQQLAGSLVIASYLNWGFFGALALQVYNYYSSFRNDVRHIKVLVYTIFLVELVQTVIVSQNVYAALAVDDSALLVGSINRTRLYWLSIPLIGGIVGGVGQLYFAVRMWRMSKGGSKVAPIIISVLAIASTVSSVVAAFFFSKRKVLQTLPACSGVKDNGAEGNIMFPFLAWNGIGAICDIVISLTMPYYLMRSGTDYHPTHVIVVRLVAVIIETGLFTSIIVITHLTLFVAKNIWFIVPGVSMSKAYTITMLVLLNRRKDDRERMNQGRRSGSVSSASGGPASPSSLRQVGMGQGGGITVGPTALRVRLLDYPGPASTIPLYQTLDGSNGNLRSSAGKSEA